MILSSPENGKEKDCFKGLEGVAADPLRINEYMRDLDPAEREKLEIELKAQNEGVLAEKKHEFDKEMVDFNQKFEEQIDKHINANSYTDRKISGVIIGTTIFGGVGFLVFNGTLVFGISGSKRIIRNLTNVAVLGFILGGLVGSRIRRKIDLKSLSIDEALCFKVNHIISWTKTNQKKIDQLWYAILLERVSQQAVSAQDTFCRSS